MMVHKQDHHIGFDGGREKESCVVGAEAVQIEVDGSFDEGGETAASILPVPPL